MFPMVGILFTASLFTVASFAAAGGDKRSGRYSQDKKQAYAAAEAGLHDYLFHLIKDDQYWRRCTNVPAPHAVNQQWSGAGVDPRTWRKVSDATAEYTLELLPANGATQCVENSDDSMIDTSTRTFRVRVTGRVPHTDGTPPAKRTIVATFKRQSFLDYLYFTDYETTDPSLYSLTAKGRQTNPDQTAWASTNCPRYWRNGRDTAAYNGQIFWFDNAWRSWTGRCADIAFAPNDVVAGPMHSNDEFSICGSPTFGRNAQDPIEVGAPGQGWHPRTTVCDPADPQFAGTFKPGSPILSLPSSNSQLKTIVNPSYLFTGKTTIRFNGTNQISVNNVMMPAPANGVIYVQNGTCGQQLNVIDPYNSPAGCADVYVKGAYATNITVASEKDIIIDGDLNKAGDTMLGLIANGFVRIYHPTTYPNLEPSPASCTNLTGTMQHVRVDAAILALQHSFMVDRYYCGAQLGTLTINGAIAQKFRGSVAVLHSGVGGYIKDYIYDDRLRYRSPPYFLDPVQAEWRIARQTERTPPR